MIAAGTQVPLLASSDFRRIFVSNPLTSTHAFSHHVWLLLRARNGYHEGGI